MSGDRPSHLVRRSALVLAALLIAGCLSALVAWRSRRDRTIFVIPRTTALVLWESEHAGAEAAAHQLGYRIYWNAPTREDDFTRQIALINRAVDRGSKGLIIAPDQALALMNPVREAVARGIPTVIIGSPLPIPPSRTLGYILSDEDEAGRLAAARVSLILHGKGKVALVGIDPDIAGIMTRTRSFERYLAQQSPGIAIVEKRIGTLNIAQAQLASEEVLSQHADLDVLLAMNGEATRGAYLALGGRNLLGRVKLVGCDQELVPPLHTGELDSIIAENTYAMGYEAVQWIARARQGDTSPMEIRLKPMLVTRDNVDSPAVQQMFTMDWDPKL